MINIEIRLIVFFAAKDGEALYSQQKQDQALTVAQTKRVTAPEPGEGNLASRRVEEGLSRSFSG